MALPTCIYWVKSYKEFEDDDSYESRKEALIAVFAPLFIFFHHFARYVLLEPFSVALHCGQTTDMLPL